MRDLMELNRFRDFAGGMSIYGSMGDGGNGVFRVPSPIDQRELLVIVSDGLGWDHVSVSARKRCPNWREMEYVKRLFFRDEEAAMQLHVPILDHVNCHARCLHLWRPQSEAIPRPPAVLVGPVTVETGARR